MGWHHRGVTFVHDEGMKTWMKWAIAVVVVVVLAAVGGPFVYINFIKEDAPDRLTLSDADELAPTTTAGSPTPTATATTATGAAPTAAVPATTATTAAVATGAAESWTVDGAASTVGYRVVEVLFGQDTEGVGRTNAVTGQMTLAGSQVTDATFEVDMATVTSDEARRDNQFRGRLLSTDQFPTATFALTAPIDLGGAPAEGSPVTAGVTGDLTLRGTTKPVTFEVQAQRSGDVIQVVGSTDIVFADYTIPMPDVPGITTQDHGLLEFDLRFVPA